MQKTPAAEASACRCSLAMIVAENLCRMRTSALKPYTHVACVTTKPWLDVQHFIFIFYISCLPLLSRAWSTYIRSQQPTTRCFPPCLVLFFRLTLRTKAYVALYTRSLIHCICCCYWQHIATQRIALYIHIYTGLTCTDSASGAIQVARDCQHPLRRAQLIGPVISPVFHSLRGVTAFVSPASSLSVPLILLRPSTAAAAVSVIPCTNIHPADTIGTPAAVWFGGGSARMGLPSDDASWHYMRRR